MGTDPKVNRTHSNSKGINRVLSFSLSLKLTVSLIGLNSKSKAFYICAFIR